MENSQMDDSPNFDFGPADQEALENRRRAQVAASYAEVSETRRLSEVYAAPNLDAIEQAIRNAPSNTRPLAPPPRHPLLAAREFTHGDFAATAMIAQRFKDISKSTPNWNGSLTDIQRESLEGIFTKIARILSGDPNHSDSWRDIAGYAHLVSEQL
jgi:hypothetical protein